MTITPQNVTAAMARIQADPSVSYWLKNALTALVARDVVDASHDAALLSIIMTARAQYVLGHTVRQ